MSILMANRELSFNCYGESLDTSPDFLMAKRAYEESLLAWEELEDNCGKIGESHLEITEHIPNFDTPLKKNLESKQLTYNEKDILRDNVEPAGEAGNPTTVV
jgi:hypothetical protein